jgi:cyclohexadienyl dehydratase
MSARIRTVIQSACLTLALAVSWLPAAAVDAEPELQPEGEARPTLRVGTSGDYPPFSERVGKGTDAGYRGFDVAVAERFAREAGFDLRWVPFRWPEISRDLAAGRFDVAMSGVTVRPERSVLGTFTVPVVETGAVLLVREGAWTRLASDRDAPASIGDSISRLDDASLRLAVNAGGHLERVTRAHFSHARILAIPDNAGVRRALASGEVDAVVTDTLEAPRWREGLSEVRVVGPFTRDRKAYWVGASNTALASRLDVWLLQEEQSGALAELRREWLAGAATVATATPLEALLAACDERLSLMPFVAGFKQVHGIEIVDPAREERVLAAAVSAVRDAAGGEGAGPSAESVRRFYRAQIDAAVAIQRAAIAEPGSEESRSFDLASELRPALIRIGDRMAGLLVAYARSGPVDDVVLAERVAIALSRHRLPAPRIEAIGEALGAIAGASP